MPLAQNTRLSLLAFPQRWDAESRRLTIRVLLLPFGNPMKTQDGGTWPAFAGADLRLLAKAVDGEGLVRTSNPLAFEQSLHATRGAAGTAAFEALLKSLPAGTDLHDTRVPATATTARVRKELPASYTSAFDFTGPRSTDVALGGFACELRAQEPNKQRLPDKTLAWGQLLSFALRQPELAMAMGLVYEFKLTVPEEKLVEGGWIYFELDPDAPENAFSIAAQAKPGAQRCYAAQLPALSKTKSRTLFAAQLFPVDEHPHGEFDEPRTEAETYSYGFAQVVHCSQPTSVDSATNDPAKIAPGADAGLQIGWDDEQVTVWMNRQLDLQSQRAGATNDAPESPLGVQGYRIDVRDEATGGWGSLCRVTGKLSVKSVAPEAGAETNPTGAAFASAYHGELWVEPTPSRPSTNTADNHLDASLPLYFANWRGKSLVVADETIAGLRPPEGANAKPMPKSFLQPDLSGVASLRYGNTYDFRVRLADLTGGGPGIHDHEDASAAAPVASCVFSRFVAPKALEVRVTPPQGERTDTALTPAGNKLLIDALRVQRPRIGYPEALFAGIDPAFYDESGLAAKREDAIASRRAVGSADPDVDRFLLTVEARMPSHDIGQSTGVNAVDGPFRIVYSVEIPFSTDVSADNAVEVELAYEPAASIYSVNAPVSAVSDPTPEVIKLTVPTARDIRIRLQPLTATRKSGYYGADLSALVSSFSTRKDVAGETEVLSHKPETQLKAMYMQPALNNAQTLAQALNLDVHGLTLSGKPGHRVIFAASGGLRTTIESDGSEITFATQKELQQQWIVAFDLMLDCDWTWDGFEDKAMTVRRHGSPVGAVSWSKTVSAKTLQGDPSGVNRRQTRVLFFDAITNTPATGSFPKPALPDWEIQTHYKGGKPGGKLVYFAELPITTAPAQTPRLVSSGLAASPLVSDTPYTYTLPRQRFLWLEFDAPLADPEDAYFGRVVAYGPDHLLASQVFPHSIPEVTVFPALALDPEAIRTIAGEAAKAPAPLVINDFSGLDAMTQLIASTDSPTRFLLPLPDGLTPESLEMFGFWTYEFRVGHSNLWSTAQARFGRPLIVRGLQHPAPPLYCSLQRIASRGVIASALHAVTVNDGVRLTSLRYGDPQTEMIFLLYAQVTQADSAQGRNVLLMHNPGRVRLPIGIAALNRDLKTPRDDRRLTKAGGLSSSLEGSVAVATETGQGLQVEHVYGPPAQIDLESPLSFVTFPQKEIALALMHLGLELESTLSVIAVEMMPGSGGAESAVRARRLAEELATHETQQQRGPDQDSLGANLGSRRILRTSPLTPVPFVCSPEAH